MLPPRREKTVDPDVDAIVRRRDQEVKGVRDYIELGLRAFQSEEPGGCARTPVPGRTVSSTQGVKDDDIARKTEEGEGEPGGV